MLEPSAKIILDSISPAGWRLTTFEVTMHRFVLAEFNTHRLFSRNSASSRAIPVTKQLERYWTDPAYPIKYPREQPGMQGGAELEGEDLNSALVLLDILYHVTHELVSAYVTNTEPEHRLHKSVLNRYLEPFLWHTVIVTSTHWDNFFDQRVSEHAQPEIYAVASKMEAALKESTPKQVKYGEWHMPYLAMDEEELRVSHPNELRQISAARCARVSYLTHDKKRDVQADIDLYAKLTSQSPPHASPLEHVATPCRCREGSTGHPHLGNFRGWDQLRHAEFGDMRK